MPNVDDALKAQVHALSCALDRRASRAELLDRYYDGDHPVPAQITQSKQTRAYKLLMDMAKSNWPRLVVDSVDERLEVLGVRFSGGDDADDDAWEIWQRNGLDGDAGLVHQSALSASRAFAIVWAGPDQKAVITPEHASTTIVQYATGSRRTRVAALRRWCEGEKWFATLYRPDGIFKFQAGTSVASPDGWMARQVPGEDWPLENPLGVVPVVEFAVNRTLRPGVYGHAVGEFEPHLGHIDRINYTVFSWLVAMTWSGFPLRAVIGDPIVRDDDDNPIRPFDVVADSLVQIENPDGKLLQLPESQLTNYIQSVESHIKHLAAVTKTPAHYLLGELVNLSADAIRAAEAALISKIRRHHRSLGEGWEDVMRLAFLVENPADPRATDNGAEVIWKDPESRSMAERAAAATQLSTVLPWQAIAEEVLELTPQQISRYEAMRGSDQLGTLLNAAPSPAGGTAAPAVPPA